jgi:hypothetical protein
LFDHFREHEHTGARDTQVLGQDWLALAHYDSDQLAAVLAVIHEWEAAADPDGRTLPRAKRHDDKTPAAIPAVW